MEVYKDYGYFYHDSKYRIINYVILSAIAFKKTSSKFENLNKNIENMFSFIKYFKMGIYMNLWKVIFHIFTTNAKKKKGFDERKRIVYYLGKYCSAGHYYF